MTDWRHDVWLSRLVAALHRAGYQIPLCEVVDEAVIVAALDDLVETRAVAQREAMDAVDALARACGERDTARREAARERARVNEALSQAHDARRRPWLPPASALAPPARHSGPDGPRPADPSDSGIDD